MPNFRNGNKDSNPGSLDYESGILPLSYRAPMDDGVEFWSAMASLKTVAGHYNYSTISKLMRTFLLLPHSNADSERVFSMVNKICTEHRADLAQDTVAALLSVKVNSRVDSQRFEPSRKELSKGKSATMEHNRLHLHPA